jgi:receptor protein-tyrosine kinase
MSDEESPAREGGSLAERIARRLADRAPAPARHSHAPPFPRPEPPAVALASEEGDPDEDSSDPQPPPIQINFQSLEAAGVATPASHPSINARIEELRVIKRQVLKTAFVEGRTRTSENSNVIMVTSSVPGEGKTFISLNLALSFTLERDLFVLLVDADNHRRALSTLVGAPDNGVGLIDLLVDPTLRMRDIILRTTLPNLSFISSGQPHPQGSELLASKQMDAVMHDLSARYPDRLIIIDTPPLLASTEGAAMAAHVGHVLVVVEKDRTTRRNLRQTLDLLDGCDTLSCVLNKDNAMQAFSGYETEYGG